MQRFLPVLLAVVAAATGACAGRSLQEAALPSPEAVATAPAAPQEPEQRVWSAAGTASWFGRELHGRTGPNGAVLDMHGPTALHRTLPLGASLVVTNQENGTSATVVVAGRGPFHAGRLIELSYAAARDLGFAGQGTAPVRIETADPLPENGVWTVHAASFAEEEIAKALRYRLSQRYEVVLVSAFQNNIGTFYRVRVGNYPTEEKAQRIAAKLAREGLEPVVLRKD